MFTAETGSRDGEPHDLGGRAVQRDLPVGGGCAEAKDRSAMQAWGVATATEQVQPVSYLGL